MTVRWSSLPGITVLAVALLVLGASLTSTASALADDDEIVIQQDRFETSRGALIEFPMTVPPGENVTLRFARTTMAITTRVVVVDGGDGSIVVVLNT